MSSAAEIAWLIPVLPLLGAVVTGLGLISFNRTINRLKKPVAIDGKEYGPGELSERDLFRIYLKKNLLLWSERYEDEYFDKAPDVDIDIQSGPEQEAEEEVDLFEL